MMAYHQPSSATEIAEMFGHVARQLVGLDDLPATLSKIVNLAVEYLDACECAGVSMINGRKISSPASSAEMALTLDRIQMEVDEGPCLDALREHQIFITGDVPSERRWPKFSVRAHAETGVRSILSVRLYASEVDTLGSLNLYSREQSAFDQITTTLATVFATHAAVAISAAERIDNLEHKAESRDLIGRAKGILMNQHNVTDAAAFALLRDASQRLNVKVVDIAEQVNYTGDIPKST